MTEGGEGKLSRRRHYTKDDKALGQSLKQLPAADEKRIRHKKDWRRRGGRGVLARKTRDVIDQRGGFSTTEGETGRESHEGKRKKKRFLREEKGKWDDLHGLIAKARVAFFSDSRIGD